MLRQHRTHKEKADEYFVFLTPKSEVAYINDDDTLRQALETMEFHKYAAVPIVNRQGRYIGTLTERDLLWGIKISMIYH